MNIEGRDVLVVEDIIDSGLTLSYLMRNLEAREPASLEICALLTKPERREIDVPVRYVGFEIPNRFVVGYGLDFDEKYRTSRTSPCWTRISCRTSPGATEAVRHAATLRRRPPS